jgi:ankyrin repeat protein
VLQSIADQLIAANADTAGVDLVKQNALMAGVTRCPIGVLRAFIAAGVPVHGVDAAGNSAMKGAILNGRADVVSLLIDAGVDPRKEPYNVGRLASGNKAVQDALRRKPKQ